MKKIVFTLLCAIFSISCGAQIFTRVKYVDKFDDEIKEETRKTLITKTDSTFVIEEKGKTPITYCILNPIPNGTKGSKDNVVNLVGDVYGYEEAWCVVRHDMLDKYNEAHYNYFNDPSDANQNKLGKFWIFVVHRTITTQYTGSYLGEYIWLQDDLNDDKLGKDVNRIIYIK